MRSSDAASQPVRNGAGLSAAIPAASATPPIPQASKREDTSIERILLDLEEFCDILLFIFCAARKK
jgi:hypothetical protein